MQVHFSFLFRQFGKGKKRILRFKEELVHNSKDAKG